MRLQTWGWACVSLSFLMTCFFPKDVFIMPPLRHTLGCYKTCSFSAKAQYFPGEWQKGLSLSIWLLLAQRRMDRSLELLGVFRAWVIFQGYLEAACSLCLYPRQVCFCVPQLGIYSYHFLIHWSKTSLLFLYTCPNNRIFFFSCLLISV